MTFKLHTFLRGLIWEGIGVLMLFLYAYIMNSAEVRTIAIGWPIFRVITWYPYERIFKYFDKKIRQFYRSNKLDKYGREQFWNENGIDK